MAALRLFLVAALVALPLWVTSTAPAHACSGGPDITFAGQVGFADVIAVGTITEMLILPQESVAHPESLDGGGVPVEMKFAVSEYLKGSASNPVLLYSPAFNISDDSGSVAAFLSHPSSCGSYYARGSAYVMFMTRNDSLRFAPTGIFGGTRQYSDHQEVTDYIDEIRAAVAAEQYGLPDTGSGPPSHNDSHVPLIAASALAAVALAANAAFVLRRRDS
jgi:hypothetical protein